MFELPISIFLSQRLQICFNLALNDVLGDFAHIQAKQYTCLYPVYPHWWHVLRCAPTPRNIPITHHSGLQFFVGSLVSRKTNTPQLQPLQDQQQCMASWASLASFVACFIECMEYFADRLTMPHVSDEVGYSS